MKWLIVCVTLWLLSSSTSPAGDKSGLKWKTFNQGVDQAKREKKKVLIDVYADWCGWCKKMDAQTYTDKSVVRYLTDKYVVIKLNGESNRKVSYRGTEYTEAELAAAFGISGYPATIFLTSDGEPITIYPGFADASRFMNVISFIAEDHYLKMGFDEYVRTRK